MPIFNIDIILKELNATKATMLDLSTYYVAEKEGHCLATWQGHTDCVWGLAVLPTREVVSGSYDKTLKVWDVKTGECRATWQEHTGSVLALIVLANGEVVSGSFDNLIKRWDAKSGKCLATWQAHAHAITALAELPTGEVVSASGQEIKVWDVKTGTCRATWQGLTFGVTALVVLPTGEVVTGSPDHTIKIWDPKSSECRATWQAHELGVTALAVLPTGALLSGSYKEIKVWDVKTHECRAIWRGHSSNVYALEVLPTGEVVSGSSDGTIKVWNTKTGKCLVTWRGHEDKNEHGGNNEVRSLAVLPTGEVVSGSTDKTIKLWQPPTRALMLRDVKALLKRLTSYPLKMLNLQNVVLDDIDTLELKNYLQFLQQLTDLDIRKTQVSDKGVQQLQAALPHVRIQYETRAAQKPVTAAQLVEEKEDVLLLTPMAGPVPKPAVPAQPQLTKSSAQHFEEKISFSVSYTLEYEDLELGRELGRGGFGVVYQGVWRGIDIAVKQLIVTHPTEEALTEFTQEMQIMAKLRSPNIVQFYGCCVKPQYCIVMEYMPKGSLFKVLHSSQTLEWPIRYQIATDIALGLAFLHQENILHRDLKSLNVLLDEQFKAKLTDFGLAKMKTETRTTTNAKSAGTIAWMAPELFKMRGTCTKETDIYSLGITLWEIASRKMPYENAQDSGLIPMWVKEGEREDIPEDCPKKLASLITFCWNGDPSKRPPANKVVAYLKSQEDDDFAKFGEVAKPKLN